MLVNKAVNVEQVRSKFNELVKGVFEDKNLIRPNIFKIIMTTIKIMENQIKDLQLEHHKPDVLIEPRIDVASSFDFHKAREIIKLGEEEARRALGGIS